MITIVNISPYTAFKGNGTQERSYTQKKSWQFSQNENSSKIPAEYWRAQVNFGKAVKEGVCEDDCDSAAPCTVEVKEVELTEKAKTCLELVRRITNGDLAAKEELIEVCSDLVSLMAYKYSDFGERNNLSQEDLEQSGYVGLLEAVNSIEKFDPVKNPRFLSYAQGIIRKNIIDAINKNAPISHPRGAATQLKACSAALKEFHDSYGRWPIPEEFEATAGIAYKRFLELKTLYNSPRSLQERVSKPEDGILMNYIKNKNSINPEDVVVGNESEEHPIKQNKLFKKLMEAVEKLPKKIREPFSLRHGLQDGIRRNEDEIAEILGVPKSTVKGRLNLAIEKIKEYLKGGTSGRKDRDRLFLKSVWHEIVQDGKWNEKILGILTPREGKIMQLRYDLDGDIKMSQPEIGELLDMTPTRVSEREKKAVRKLKEYFEEKNGNAFSLKAVWHEIVQDGKWNERILSILAPRERETMQLRYDLNGDIRMPQSEAEKRLKLAPGSTYHYEENAIEKIKEYLKNGVYQKKDNDRQFLKEMWHEIVQDGEWNEEILSILSSGEREVMMLRYDTEGNVKMTQIEIGKLLKMTNVKASKLEKSAIGKLEEYFGKKNNSEFPLEATG